MKDEKLRPYALFFGLSLLQGMSLIIVLSILVTVIFSWI